MVEQPDHFERIAMAFAGDKSVDATLNLDNATMAETQKQAQRFRLETNIGVVIGEMFGVMDTMDTATVLAFDVKVTPEARAAAEDLGVTIFTAEIIYHLTDQFDAFLKRSLAARSMPGTQSP